MHFPRVLSKLRPVSFVGNLGLILTYRCQHMYNHGLWSAFFWLHNIKRISKFLSRDNLVAVIHAFIASRLDYWYSLLYDLPNTKLAKLQRVQKAAARSVTTTRKYDQITSILCEFHWLPVKFRIHFKIVLLNFKALYGMAPTLQNSNSCFKKKITCFKQEIA